jgi:hypothetical protein
MLAKGKVYVTLDKLAELLSLPEGVEIIAVRPKNVSDEGFEFLVMSAEETVCTKKNAPVGMLRRTSVETLETFKTGNKGGIVGSGQISIVDLSDVPFPDVDGNVTINVVLNQETDKTDAQKMFKSILDNVKKQGSGF